MINFESDLYRSHPEYALNRQSGNLSLFRHQLVLDFSNPEVVDNIYNQMKAFLQEYPVDYIKWDHNRDIGEHYSKINGNNQGEVYHRNVMGYYELLYRLTKEYPHVMIEGCSSGGGRFDMGTLFYCPQIWTSDESNPVQRININYNTSVGYPLSVMGAHVNNNKNASYKEKAILALFGTYGYEMNPNELTDSEKAELFEIANIYKQYHQKVIQEGTLYHVISPNNSNFMCMQCVSKDKSVSLAVYCNKFKMQEFSHFVKFKGLDASKKYINTKYQHLL